MPNQWNLQKKAPEKNISSVQVVTELAESADESNKKNTSHLP
jgi:hypothetical protein